MKVRTFAALTVFFCMAATAQTVYKVPADSKGNTLILTVANESPSTSAQKVSVKLLGEHPGLTISPSVATVKVLQASGSSDVAFTFGISRDVKLSSRDTLNFDIRDNDGEAWTKSIVLEYTGPQEYKLEQNFPNPFNPTTVIRFQTPGVSRVKIIIYNILGQEIVKLVDDTEEAGYYSATLSASTLASGTYIYRMIARPMAGGKTYSDVKKLLVLK